MNINFKSVNLKEFLDYKTMYYDKIDFSTIEKSFNIIEKELKLPYIIHIVGTNGKGTTGRFLSTYLNKIGKDVVHYSSPHINRFNERIWINGEYISDELLETTHKKVQNLLTLDLLEKLTYFEYTTLLAFYVSNKKEYLVLEAGLGGEFDATNVAFNNLSLITTIDLDHQSFLGNTIKDISLTKMRSVDNTMIVGAQINEEVYTWAKEISNSKQVKLLTLDDFKTDISTLSKLFPTYLQKNLLLAISALKYLDIDVDLSLFKDMKFEGRCQKYKKNITLDVGHNPLAAKSLYEVFEGKKVNLIYNSYADKDYEKVLETLNPIIKKLYILPVNDKRMVKEADLINVCKKFNIITEKFNNKTLEDEEYLVFGSFLVVENFLKIEKSLDENIK